MDLHIFTHQKNMISMICLLPVLTLILMIVGIDCFHYGKCLLLFACFFAIDLLMISQILFFLDFIEFSSKEDSRGAPQFGTVLVPC